MAAEARETGRQVVPAGARRGRRIGRLLLWLLVLLAAVGAARLWHQRSHRLPEGFGGGNGRLVAESIDVDTKFQGRIAELQVAEGDRVKAGQIVARMDTKDREAGLRKAEALLAEEEKALEEARAGKEAAASDLALAEKELARAGALLRRGNVSRGVFDRRRSDADAGRAALASAAARIEAETHAVEMARREVERDRIDIADNTLPAPRSGIVQERLAREGEVLPAGGTVLTILDAGYVYMDVYLPPERAGRVKPGDEARILLDADPDHALPAEVAFVAPRAQFTPKSVETTKDGGVGAGSGGERDRLALRIRVRLAPAFLEARPDLVRTGVPGMAYLRLDPALSWPEWLRP